MSIKIKTVEELKKYFAEVVNKSKHHAPNVNEIIYPMLGLIVLKLDQKSEILARSYNGNPANMLWININGSKYAFCYQHTDDIIEIRKDSIKGNILYKINNQTGIANLKGIFDKL